MGGSKKLVGGILDTVKGLTGIGTTQAEKAAKSAQEEQARSLMTIQADQTKALQERETRMKRKQTGRSSLLSGSELGVMPTTELKKTLG